MLAENGADAGARVRLDVVGGQQAGWISALRSIAAGRVAVTVTPPAAAESGLWRRLMSTVGQGDVARPPMVETNLVAEGPLSTGVERWQFEDECGRPLFSPFFGADVWQRRPFAMALRLVATRPHGRAVVAEAWIGTNQAYPDLLSQLAKTAVILLAKALTAAPLQAVPCAENPAVPDGNASGTAALIGGALRRQARRQSRRFATETWAVGIAERRIDEVIDNGELGAVRWIGWDDRLGYLADPFPWPGRKDRFLCERFSNDTQLGELVAIDGLDGHRQSRIDIPETGHLSYPGAWVEAAEVLLMPESGASRRTVIYRLDESGRAQTLTVVAAGCGMADPTLFRKDSLYWIAYTDTDIGPHDNLCLMYAEQLQGPWHQHPANPVKLDIRSSRPAGPFFEVAGNLYRPAQDCAADYGAALAINRIVEWSITQYREELVTVLRPDPHGRYPHGLHTLSVWGDRLLVDGKRWRRRPDLLADKVFRRLRGPAHV